MEDYANPYLNLIPFEAEEILPLSSSDIAYNRGMDFLQELVCQVSRVIVGQKYES